MMARRFAMSLFGKKAPPRIINQTAYDQFIQLKEIEPQAASFEARFIGPRMGDGGRKGYIFETIPSRFFGAKKPCLSIQAKGINPSL